MDNPAAPKSIAPSQGVHLVLDKKFYPSEEALMIPSTSDGRVLFAVPWHGKVVVGTTDTPVDEESPEPRALESEIAFILENAGRYLVQQPKRTDVLSVYAGLRPLAAPQGDTQKTKEISRSHKIIVSPSHLFTMVGGKWTTFRKMGEDMVTRVEKELSWPHKQTATKQLPIHGHTENVDQHDPLYFYGSDAAAVKALANNNHPISKSLQIYESQVIWAVRAEMARTVEDVLSRRTRALLLDARESIRMAPAVAAIMAREMQKDAAWTDAQVAAYTKLAEGYLLK
jgi:glycerol-3-phosphate dehydrogenase